MDLSRLTRPAILGQCSRCSSSLAALENEWARLSNSYSIATAWLSVDLHRISVSSERKQIPQTSDLKPLRGRIIQEVACKLCQQKLGVLCELHNGPHIFWKMAKVSFREIVTMRTVEPLFNDGALDRLIAPTLKESGPRDRDSAQNGALVPTGSSEMEMFDPSMQQQMQHQGRSIDQISNSVNNLQDTMTDLKHSFTALRIELNDPSRHLGENGTARGYDFNMITTVLKELKSKSDEIEKLKLEIEALKLKNLFIEKHTSKQPDSLEVANGMLAEVRSPGLLQAGRKRPWPDAFASGRTRSIADSFDEGDDIDDDILLADLPTHPSRVPLKEPHTVRAIADGQRHGQVNSEPLEVYGDAAQQGIAKRPRLSQPNDGPDHPPTQKRPVGRPRKSISQSARPDVSQITPATSSSEQKEAVESTHTQSAVPEPSPSAQSHRGRGPGRPSRRVSRSRRASINGHSNLEDVDQAGNDSLQNAAAGKPDEPQNGEAHHAPAHEGDANEGKGADDAETVNEKRKAKVAARDLMTRMAMQREEAMETEEAR